MKWPPGKLINVDGVLGSSCLVRRSPIPFFFFDCCWSGDRFSEPSTHLPFFICWLSCAACPVCRVCPVLRVFSAESAFSLCVEWVCEVGVSSFLVPCSPAHSFPLKDAKRRRLSSEASILYSASLPLSLVGSYLCVYL